jgi:glucose/mannose-6-phosphate isomerase
MLRKDDKQFLSYLKQFPQQIYESKELVDKINFKIDSGNIKNIYFCGMGGSAIAGDVFKDLFIGKMDVPFYVHRGYHLPYCVHNDSLVIVSSYSGNTEETMSILKEAKEREANIIAITSGGKIGEMMEGKNTVTVPEGFPPRQAFGYSFFSLLYALQKLNFVSVQNEEIEETVSILNNISRHNDPESHDHVHFARTFAQSLLNKVPVFYADSTCCGSLAYRWRTQINENSKSLSYSNTFPEQNHNEIVGYDMNPEIIKHFIFVFLRDPEREEPRMQKRIELTKKILSEKNCKTMEIFPEGKSSMAKTFSLLYRGDWVSFYLARLYEVSPIKISNIDFLKTELDKS